MDFHGFHEFPLILMVFRDLVSWMLGGDEVGLVAPIETFARFEAFHRFSEIFIDVHGFPGFH